MPRSNEAFLLSGWLFADLLLALAVLFLAANTGGIKAKPLLPPTLTVNPTILDINKGTAPCTVQINIAQCTITVGESAASAGDIAWSVSSDISESINYASKSGRLSPGHTQSLAISAIPCQNGSFTFQANRITDRISDKAPALTVVVLLRCTPHQERLDFNYQTFQLNVNNVNALLTSNSQDEDIKQQIRSQFILNGRSVGLAVVYAGAPNSETQFISQAQKVAQRIYDIMGNLGSEGFAAFARSSFYRRDASSNVSIQKKPLYNLGNQPGQVQVDVYFFTNG